MGTPYRVAVPNNDLDLVASAWAKGREPKHTPHELKTMKTVSACHLLDDHPIQYIWRLPSSTSDELNRHVSALRLAAAGVTCLGWGVDLAIGHAAVLDDIEHQDPIAVVWAPASGGGDRRLRTPVGGTLNDVRSRHAAFLRRVGPGGFNMPPELSIHGRVEYRQSTDAVARPIAAFALLSPNTQSFRPFDTARRALTVAGMVRHAVSQAARRTGWSEDRVRAVFLGHFGASDENQSRTSSQRLAYVPVPSIEFRGAERTGVVGDVRRVLVTTFGIGLGDELTWVRRTVSGEELVDARTGEIVALLSSAREADSVLQRYLRPASTWATVTPVVLPGYDDPAHYRRRLAEQATVEQQHELLGRLAERTDGLVRKAIIHAGISTTLAHHALVDWRVSGFWPGTDLAYRYGCPNHLARFSRYHVKISWRDARGAPVDVPGPICIGGGRHYGLGLFAAVDEPR